MTLAQFGRYEIRSELGRGGMATVYLAYDPRFKREVAIKVLPREFAHEPSFRARFEREAETVAGLEHSAIVPVYDFGEEDGQPYFVMRYMSGGSLTERIQSGSLDAGQICRILDRIAPALDEAHARGIVHRDLKPANILFDQFGDAYIGDFGIVKLAEGSSTLTGTGMIVGTPAYMSPEQADGLADLDGKSDLYSLGIILFEMLTGAQPFHADTPMRVLIKHLSEPVPLVSRFRGDLSPEFQTILDRALAKRREDRYATAARMAADMRAACSRAPVSPPPPRYEPEATFVEEVGWSQPAMPAPSMPPPVPARRKGIPAWVWIAGGGIAALICLGAAGLGAFSLLGNPSTDPTSTPEVPIIGQVTARPADTRVPATEHPDQTAVRTGAPPTSALPPVLIHPYCEMDGESPVTISAAEPVTLYWTWTALTTEQVQDHIDAGHYEVRLDGEEIEAQRRGEIEYDSASGYYKVSWFADVGILPPGEHTASRSLSWTEQIFDGWDTFGPGGEFETEFHTCTIIVR